MLGRISNNDCRMEACGERIREIRVSNRDTQEDLAEKAQVSIDTIKRMESGKFGKVDSLLSVAAVYQASLDYVMFGKLKEGK